MKTTLLKLLLSWLAGITSEQWKSAVELVTEAAGTALSGNAKAVFVADKLKQSFPGLSGWIANLLRETALAWVKKHSAK